MIFPPVTGMISADECKEPDSEPVEAGAGEGAGDGTGEGVGVGGTVVSTTVTWKLPRAMFPAVSLAEQLTVVTPMLKVEPEGGTQATDTLGSKSSVAEAVYVTTAPLGPAAFVVMSAGRLRVGAVVSVANVPLEQPLRSPVQAGACWIWIVVFAGFASSMP
jgi:hypothetical protein